MVLNNDQQFKNLNGENGEIKRYSQEYLPEKYTAVDDYIDKELLKKINNKDLYYRAEAYNKLEKRILKGQHCPANVSNMLGAESYKLNYQATYNYMNQKGLYDYNFQKGVGCLIDGVVSDNFNSVPDLRLKKWITQIKGIGDKSETGKAYLLSHKKIPLFVIKISADVEQDELTHEAFVGMAALNKLRSKIPNFMQTYGAFLCSPPVTNIDGDVISWCVSRNEKINYIILENIHNNLSFRQSLTKLSLSDFLEIFLQITNALNVAYKNYKFIHYDLHAENVLIQKLPYQISIPIYYEDGTTKYLKTKFLAKIIDYGMSRIVLDGYYFGYYGFEHLGVNAQGHCEIYDVYKLLLFSFMHYKSSKQQILLEIFEKIYKFFGDKKINDRLSKKLQSDTDYFQPPKFLDNLKISQFFIHISDLFNNVSPEKLSPTPPDDAVLSICLEDCVKMDNFTQIIFKNKKIENILDYYLLLLSVDKLPTNNTPIHLNETIHSVNYYHLFLHEAPLILKDIIFLTERLTALDIIDTSKFLDAQQIENYFAVENYLPKLSNFVKIYTKYSNYEIWFRAAKYIFHLSDIDNYPEQLSNYSTLINNIKNSLSILNDDLDNLKSTLNTHSESLLSFTDFQLKKYGYTNKYKNKIFDLFESIFNVFI